MAHHYWFDGSTWQAALGQIGPQRLVIVSQGNGFPLEYLEEEWEARLSFFPAFKALLSIRADGCVADTTRES